MQVIARLGLPVVHGILLHAHEGRIGIGLAVGVAFAQSLKVIVILGQLVAHLLYLLDLFLLITYRLLLFLAHGSRHVFERLAQFIGNLRQCLRSETHGFVSSNLVLGDGIVNL